MKIIKTIYLQSHDSACLSVANFTLESFCSLDELYKILWKQYVVRKCYFHQNDNNKKTRLFKYILKILQPKKENFQNKKSLIFFIFLFKT